jgi:hypothetical protein
MTRPGALAVAVPLVAAATLAGCAAGTADSSRPEVSPPPTAATFLPRSHSHNNYEQGLPLLDALSRGFASIEADVVLLDGELYVAHGADDVQPDRTPTLASLYLDPLREVVRSNGGAVYGPSDPPLQLLVDVKTEAYETYAALDEVLGRYSDILTTWTDGVALPGAVDVVLSGNRALDLIERAPVRHVAIDGRILDDRAGVAPEAMPLVSEDWERLGPPTEEARLAAARRVVEQMHSEGRKVRFWATPESEEVWRSLIAMGVDYIGTDDPERLEGMLRDSEGSGAAAID